MPATVTAAPPLICPFCYAAHDIHRRRGAIFRYRCQRSISSSVPKMPADVVVAAASLPHRTVEVHGLVLRFFRCQSFLRRLFCAHEYGPICQSLCCMKCTSIGHFPHKQNRLRSFASLRHKFCKIP